MENVTPGADAVLAPEAPGSAGTARRFPAALLLAGSCMPVLGAVLLAPVLPAMTRDFAATPGAGLMVPVVLTLPALLIAVVSPIAGQIADKVGRKRLLLAAMIAYSVLGTAPLWLSSLPLILASRAGVGAAEACIMTVCTTLITDYYAGKARDRYLGLQVLVASVAATAFFALGGVLGAQSWRAPFWLYIAAAFLAIPMAFVLWEPKRDVVKARFTPVPWRQVGIPCLVTFFGGIVFYALVVQLPYLLTNLGVNDVAVIGAGTALASVATAVGAFSFRFLARMGPQRLLVVAFSLAAVGLVVVWVATSVTLALVGALVTSTGTGLLLPTLLTWAVSGLQLEQRGRGTGVWTGTLYVGQFISPIVLGTGGAFMGGLQSALGALGVLTAAAAIVAAVAARRTRRAAP
ncbi:MFS transporter [Sinomonas susongensis]|uniref:MFS transporter n=1 Tax=Sinomonas susongensis TaxID=1324851 RepID=UPI0011082F9E|nr:MFS transporter [Sinomonas susongensis]